MEELIRKALLNTPTKLSENSETNLKNSNRKSSAKKTKSVQKVSVSGKKTSTLLPSARKSSKVKNLNNVLKNLTNKKLADMSSPLKNKSNQTFTNFTNLNAKKMEVGKSGKGVVNKKAPASISKSKDGAAKGASSRFPTNRNQKTVPSNNLVGKNLTIKKSVSENKLAVKKTTSNNSMSTRKAASTNSLAAKKLTSTNSILENKKHNLTTKKMASTNRLATKTMATTDKFASRKNATAKSLVAKKMPSLNNSATKKRVFSNNLATKKPNTLATKKMACKLIDYKENGPSKSLATKKSASTTGLAIKQITGNLPNKKKSFSTNLIKTKVPASTSLPNKKLDANLTTKNPAYIRKTAAPNNLVNKKLDSKKLPLVKRLNKIKEEKKMPVSRIKKAPANLENNPTSPSSKRLKTAFRSLAVQKKSVSVSFDKESYSSNIGNSYTLFKSPTRPMMTTKSRFLPQLESQSLNLPNLVVPVLSTMEEINLMKESVEETEIDDDTIRLMLENAEKFWDTNVSNINKKLRPSSPSKKSNPDENVLNLSKIGEDLEIEDTDLEDMMNNSLKLWRGEMQQNIDEMKEVKTKKCEKSKSVYIQKNSSLQNQLQEKTDEIENVVDQLAKCLQKNQKLNEEVKMLKSKNKNLKLESKKLLDIQTEEQSSLIKKLSLVENDKMELCNLNKNLEAIVLELKEELCKSSKKEPIDENYSTSKPESNISFTRQSISAVEAEKYDKSEAIGMREVPIKVLQKENYEINSKPNSKSPGIISRLSSSSLVNIDQKEEHIKDILFNIIDSFIAKNESCDKNLGVIDNISVSIESILWDIVKNINISEPKNADKENIQILKRKCSQETTGTPHVKRRRVEMKGLASDDSTNWTEDIILDMVCNIQEMESDQMESYMEQKLDPELVTTTNCIGQIFSDILNNIEDCDTKVKPTKTFSIGEILMDIVNKITERIEPKRSLKRKLDENEHGSPVKKLKFDLQLPLPLE